MMAKIDVDREAFEKLVAAIILDGCIANAVAALDEMKLVQGHTTAGAIILLARKRARGIVDVERQGEQYPVVGLRVGSTLRKPLPA